MNWLVVAFLHWPEYVKPVLTKYFPFRNTIAKSSRLSSFSRRSLHYVFVTVLLLCLTACASSDRQALNLNTIDLETYTVSTETPLMSASRSGDVTALRRALVEGEKVNALSEQGTAFSIAIGAQQFAIAEFLLGIGADPELGEKEGEISALMQAASVGRNDLVKALIRSGFDVNYRDWREHSAMSLATINGHLTTMKILISAGADVNIDAEGRSLLQHAVADNNSLLAQVLIRAGADVNYRNAAGETALRIARRGGYFDLDLMLVQAGAD